MAFLRCDASAFALHSEHVLGLGRRGIVLRRGDYALKIAKVRDASGLSDEQREQQEYLNHISPKILQNEKDIYYRIGRHWTIADCVDISRDWSSMDAAIWISTFPKIPSHCGGRSETGSCL